MGEEALCRDHPNVAIDLTNLAALYYSQGKYAEVEPLYKRALMIREKALGPAHPNVVNLLENMAEFFEEIGEDERDKRAIERVKKFRLGK